MSFSTSAPVLAVPSLALVSLSGPHGSDISHALLDACARHAVVVRDMAFTRVRHNVTFAALVLASDSARPEFIAAVRDAAEEWDAAMEVKLEETGPPPLYPMALEGSAIGTQSSDIAGPLANDAQSLYADGKSQIGLEEAPYSSRIKYAATVLDSRASGLSSAFLAAWNRFLLDRAISIEKMQRLNDLHISPLHSQIDAAARTEPGLICVDYRLSVPASVNLATLRTDMFALSRQFNSDVALQLCNVFRRHKRLVVFDMDSTLVQQEVIDELAREIGVVDQVAAITHRAMNGEMDFRESLRQRVALLRGAPVEVVDRVKARLTYTPGAQALCHALKRAGLKLAVISGGFMPMALRVKEELRLDYAFANRLATSSDGKTLTGETIGPIVDATRKAELLEVIAQAENIGLQQVIAVGDGANDLPMLGKAGLGVAFNAKPTVQERAATRINQKSLAYVLYLMGYSDEEISELMLE